MIILLLESVRLKNYKPPEALHTARNMHRPVNRPLVLLYLFSVQYRNAPCNHVVQFVSSLTSSETGRTSVTNLHLTLVCPVLFENARSIRKS